MPGEQANKQCSARLLICGGLGVQEKKVPAQSDQDEVVFALSVLFSEGPAGFCIYCLGIL